MFDAPISVRPAGAASGSMTIWVRGDSQVFDRRLYLLRKFANAPHYVGEIATGAVKKLTHNTVGYMILIRWRRDFPWM
jgi:3-hydroxyisobutyrate dehydrogenase-like beta-hydroxyacid dehydrogenase